VENVMVDKTEKIIEELDPDMVKCTRCGKICHISEMSFEEGYEGDMQSLICKCNQDCFQRWLDKKDAESSRRNRSQFRS